MTNTSPTAPTLWSRTNRQVAQLPTPAAIARMILATGNGAHNGLRAASYDGKVSGGSGISHPERMLAERHPDQFPDTQPAPGRWAKAKPNRRAIDDLRTLSKASERYVTAVASLLAEALDQGCPDLDDYTWDQAIKDARILGQPQHELHPDETHDRTKCGCITPIEAGVAAGRDIDRWVRQAAGAVKTIRALLIRYRPRASTAWEQYKRAGGRADEVCEVHAALHPPVYKRKDGREQLCKTCGDLKRKAGERPPIQLIQLLETGTQMQYRKARSRWLQDLSIQPQQCGA